ncbi:MAG TPA: hypothetical protein V6D20_17965, partial [Candidatus Obscuribacterales bacterium]
MSGGYIENYLLEKSRVVAQAAGERNYHAFYLLLAGAPDQARTALALQPSSSYHYLNQSQVYEIEGLDEVGGP